MFGKSTSPSAGPSASPTRLPLMIALVAVAIIGAAYYWYYAGRRDYFIDRNLRILTAISGQIDASIESQQELLRNRTTENQTAEPCPSPRPRPAIEDRTLRVEWSGTEVPATAAKMLGDYSPADGGTPLETRYRCGDVPIDSLLEPILNGEGRGVFDALFVAGADGRILYSATLPRSTSTLLRSSVATSGKLNAGYLAAGSVRLPTLDPIQVQTGIGFGFGETKLLDAASLTQASRHLNVEINGDRHVLFTQPHLLRQATTEPDGRTVKGESLIVGGIISARRFRSDATAISAAKVALAVAFALLAICAWPFLRIALIPERHGLTVTDVIFVGFCAFAGAIVLTLTILDALVYRQLSATADAQLQHFAYKLEYDFTHNVVAASKVLNAVEDWSIDHVWSKPAESGLRDPKWGLFTDRYKATGDYPYFSSFAWIDADGRQRFKGSLDAEQPLLDVHDRKYFTNARDDEVWDVRPTAEGKPQFLYALQWVRSRLSGQWESVLARPSRDPSPGKSLPVIALAAQLIDVTATVPPPGVQFAIIDEQGAVLYHSDERRIGRENFFVETDHHRELRTAVLGRTDAAVHAAYWGEDQSLFVHPLRNTEWTLVAFRGKRLVRAANIEALLMTVIALLINVLPYVIVFGAVLAIRPTYRAPSLWPDENRAADYARLATVLGLGSLTMALTIYAIEPRSVIPLLVLLPLQAFVAGYILLHRRRRRRLLKVAWVVWTLATLNIIRYVALANIDADLLVSAQPNWTRALLLAAVLFESVVALDLARSTAARQSSSETSAESEPAEQPQQILHNFGAALAAFSVAAAIALLAQAYAVPTPAIVALLQTFLSIIWVRLSPADPRWNRAGGAWLAATIALLLTMIFTSREMSAWVYWSLGGFFLILQISVVAYARKNLGQLWFHASVRPISYPFSYFLCGVFLLGIGGILPAVGYFKIATRIEQESLLKYAQLRFATMLERRIDRVAGLACPSGSSDPCPGAGAASRDIRRYRLTNVGDTLWRLDQGPPPAVHWSEEKKMRGPDVLLSLVPRYSEDSVAMRQLYGPGSEDRLWQWNRDNHRTVRLARVISLPVHASKLLWPGDTIRQRVLHLTSYIPLMFPSFVSIENTQHEVASPLRFQSAGLRPSRTVDVGSTAGILAVFAALVGAVWWMVRFIARKILLIDVQAPDWADLQTGVALGENVFLVHGESCDVGELVKRHEPAFHVVSFEQIEKDGAWERTTAHRHTWVAVRDFDYEVDDPAMNAKKLSWLERLLAADRRVVIFSAIPPSVVTRLASPPSKTPQLTSMRRLLQGGSPKPGYRERWQAVLGAFVWLSWEDVSLRADLRKKNAEDRDLAKTCDWLVADTETSTTLADLAKPLLRITDRDRIIDELTERAETFYAAQWESCTPDEKLLLYHLAHNGFVHNKSRRVLRRLMGRGLIRRRPNLELLSETFRLFVLCAADREKLPELSKRISNESALAAFRTPALIVLASFFLLLFATQKDLMSVTVALATALTTGLPALAKMFGLIGERRGDPAPRG
jgi:hypothetical protein